MYPRLIQGFDEGDWRAARSGQPRASLGPKNRIKNTDIWARMPACDDPRLSYWMVNRRIEYIGVINIKPDRCGLKGGNYSSCSGNSKIEGCSTVERILPSSSSYIYRSNRL